MSMRPEQTFFDDPALDRALGLIMTLAAELHVARDHTRVLESILVEKGLIGPEDVQHYEPPESERAKWDARRDDFVAALMANIEGRQMSKGVG